MRPLISVIMPVYNQEKYLAETIESVLTQTYSNFEFLILDDGSTDKSSEIIKKFSSKDKRIVALYQTNTGKSDATNSLVRRAKGQWCAFLDADDLMLPYRLEKQLAFHLKNPIVDATSCHCYYIDEKGKHLGQQCYPFLKSVNDFNNTLAEGKIVLCAFTGMMIKRKVFLESEGLRHQFWPAEDLEFVNRLIDRGRILLIIQDFMMKYRVHASSVTNSNTWHSYVDISGYTKFCINLRRAGKPEITLKEYKELRLQDAWWIKFNRIRFYYSQVLHREAGFALYSKKYFHFLWQILAATLFSPTYILASLLKRVKLKMLLHVVPSEGQSRTLKAKSSKR